MRSRAYRPLILLTNDDGVSARGRGALRQAAEADGDAVIVAPTRAQSAQSHAITLDRPMRHIEHEQNVHSRDCTAADCVYLVLYERRFLPRGPDIVRSAIHAGHNLGTSVIDSATLAVAHGPASRGISAPAVSALPDVGRQPLPSIATGLTRAFAQCAAQVPTTPLLNVNFPSGSCKGVHVTCVERQRYDERVSTRRDPNRRETHGTCFTAYIWMGGRVTESSETEGTDAHAVLLGYV